MSDVVMVNANLPGRSITVREQAVRVWQRSEWAVATAEQLDTLAAADVARRNESRQAIEDLTVKAREAQEAAATETPELPAEPVNPDKAGMAKSTPKEK